MVIMNTLIICAASIISLQPEFETVYWDTVTKDGRFDGGRLLMEMSETTNFVEQGIAGVTTIIDNGPTDNRIDIVFVGDGGVNLFMARFSEGQGLGDWTVETARVLCGRWRRPRGLLK